MIAVCDALIRGHRDDEGQESDRDQDGDSEQQDDTKYLHFGLLPGSCRDWVGSDPISIFYQDPAVDHRISTVR
jgi:hypothetical protein